MHPAGQRKCCHCNEFFLPDARHRQRQRYCAAPQCRRVSKAASQRRWLSRPENRDYFRGPDNVERVRTWRAAHPDFRAYKCLDLYDDLVAGFLAAHLPGDAHGG